MILLKDYKVDSNVLDPIKTFGRPKVFSSTLIELPFMSDGIMMWRDPERCQYDWGEGFDPLLLYHKSANNGKLHTTNIVGVLVDEEKFTYPYVVFSIVVNNENILCLCYPKPAVDYIWFYYPESEVHILDQTYLVMGDVTNPPYNIDAIISPVHIKNEMAKDIGYNLRNILYNVYEADCPATLGTIGVVLEAKCVL